MVFNKKHEGVNTNFPSVRSVCKSHKTNKQTKPKNLTKQTNKTTQPKPINCVSTVMDFFILRKRLAPDQSIAYMQHHHCLVLLLKREGKKNIKSTI